MGLTAIQILKERVRKWGLLLQDVETEQQREDPSCNTQDTTGSKPGPAPKEVGAILSKVLGLGPRQ